MISKIIFKTMRGPFLILTPAVLMPAFSLAIAEGAAFRPFLYFLLLTGALTAHISVNVLNEYCDFISGVDFLTKQTPFSGGSKALTEKPEQVKNVFFLFLASLLYTVFSGLYFFYLTGPGILPIGILGILIILTYTTRLNQIPILCLLAPGTGFGILMVSGTYYVIMNSFSLEIFLISFVPFFLVNNLLLLNQLPDIEADKKAGRYHFPIVYGYKKSLLLYMIFNICAAAILMISPLKSNLPGASAAAALPVLLSIPVYLKFNRYEKFSSELVPYMGINVFIVICTPLAISAAIYFG